MADGPLFNWASDEIERLSGLNRLQSRGLLRLALKNAGLDSAILSPRQLTVVAEKILPKAFAAQGVARAADICELLRHPPSDVSTTSAESPADVFLRLAGPKK